MSASTSHTKAQTGAGTTVDPQEVAMLAAAAAAPHDDLTRLVYADYLDELGRSARAEYIREQCEARRLWKAGSDESWVVARRSNAARVARWAEFFGPLAGLPAEAFAFSRGLLTGVDLGGAPRPRELVLRLLESPELQTVTRLDSSNQALGPEGAAAVAGCPHLGSLTRLDVSGNDVRTAGARTLTRSPHLARLDWLSLADNGLDGDVTNPLVGFYRRHGERLTHLLTRR